MHVINPYKKLIEIGCKNMDGLNVLKSSWLMIGEKKYGIDIPSIIAGIILISYSHHK